MYVCICLSVYGSTVHLLDHGSFFRFLILYTAGRTPWTGDQPVARPLPTQRTTQTENKRTQYRHPYLKWDSNPRFQRSSERRQFISLYLTYRGYKCLERTRQTDRQTDCVPGTVPVSSVEVVLPSSICCVRLWEHKVQDVQQIIMRCCLDACSPDRCFHTQHR
jgi:hypothetical protein